MFRWDKFKSEWPGVKFSLVLHARNVHLGVWTIECWLRWHVKEVQVTGEEVKLLVASRVLAAFWGCACQWSNAPHRTAVVEPVPSPAAFS